MITKTTIDAIPGRTINTKVMREIMEFHKSDWDAAEVDTDKYVSVSSAYTSYKAAVARLRVAVTPMCRCGKLYLIRTGPKVSEGE